MPDIALPLVEIEALRLAAVDCVGRYGVEHLDAWRDLAARGLVENVSDRGGMSRFYRITPAGAAILSFNQE